VIILVIKMSAVEWGIWHIHYQQTASYVL